MEMPLDEYRQWVEAMPAGPGRYKLEGLLKWGEIEINRSHAADLFPVLKESLSNPNAAGSQCSNVLLQFLQKMTEEPALYLMVRRYA